MARRRSQDLVLTITGNVSQLDAAKKAARTILNEIGTDADNLEQRVNQAFRELGGGDVEQSARRITSAYDRMFKQISSQARQITADTAQAGALQLLDANAAEEAARVATLQAEALREVGRAAELKGKDEGESAEASRRLATQAFSAANALEVEATEATATAAALRNVQGAIDATEVAQKKQTRTSGQQQAGMQQLSYQMSDVASQAALGINPLVIFAQQGSQVVYALNLMQNGAGKYARFMAGPWGAAILGGISILGLLVMQMDRKNETLDQSVRKLQQEARETARNNAAREEFSRTLEGQIELYAQLIDEAERLLDTEARANRRRLDNARSATSDLERDLAQKREQLTRARQDLETTQNSRRMASGDAQISSLLRTERALQRRINVLESQIDRIETLTLPVSRSLERQFEIPIIEDRNAAGLDPSRGEQARFERERDALRERFHRPGSDLSREAFEELDRTLQRDHERRMEEIRESDRRSGRSPERGLESSFISPVDGARLSGRYGERRGRRLHGGVDLAVPVGTPVRATADGRVDFAGAAGNYGNLVRIDHGAGTETRYAHLSRITASGNVQQGDIIGYSGGARGAPGSGNSRGPHLHYEVRRQGRTVDPTTGRYATDAGETEVDYLEEQQRLAEEALERARTFEDQIGEARLRLINATFAVASSTEDRRRIEDDIVDGERAARDAQLERQVADGELTAAQARRITLTHASADALEDEARAAARRQDDLDRELDAQRDAIDTQATLLYLQLDFADALDERRRIARQLLALELEERRRVAQRLIASDDPDQRARGERDLARIDAEEPFRRRQLERDNADPLQRYFEQLRLASADMDSSLKSIAAGGMQDFEDRLWGLATGAEGVADAISEMTLSVLADLARLGTQRLIFEIFGGLAGGSGSGGFNGGFGGGVNVGANRIDTGGVAGLIGGALGFSGGGDVRGPGTSTSDSILARLSNGEFVLDAETTRRYRPLIEAMHYGSLPGFADGGSIDLTSVRPPRLPDLRELRAPSNDNGSGYTVNLTQTNNFAGGAATKEDVQRAQQATYAGVLQAINEQRRRGG